jgi:hypothetical protein
VFLDPVEAVSYRFAAMAAYLQIPQRFRDAHIMFTADLRAVGAVHDTHEVAYSQKESGRILRVSMLPNDSVESAFDVAVALVRRLLDVGEPTDESDDEGRCFAWGFAQGRVSVSSAMDTFVAFHVFLRVNDGQRAIRDLMSSAPLELAALCKSLGQINSISMGSDSETPHRWSVQGDPFSEPSDRIRKRLLASGFQPMPSGRALAKNDLGVQFRDDNTWAVALPAPSFL